VKQPEARPLVVQPVTPAPQVPTSVPAPPEDGKVDAAYSQQRPRAPRSRSAARLTEMLRNPQSIRMAVVLREILDRPLCQRRRKTM
jgi:hypothetical protein